MIELNGIYNKNGEMIINNCNITSNSGHTEYIIFNEGKEATLTIEKANINTYRAENIVRNYDGKVTIKDGEYNFSSNTTNDNMIRNNAEMEILGGIFRAEGLKIIDNGKNLFIKGGKFYGGGISNRSYSSLLEIDGADTYIDLKNNYGIWNYGILNIYNGTIKVAYNGYVDAIHNNGGSLSIYGGNIEATGTGSSGEVSGIWNSDVKITNIIGGSIVAKAENPNCKVYGIKVHRGTADIILGTLDEMANIEVPRIEGVTNGIYNPTSKIQFYDGIVIGKTPISNFSISKKEENYDVIVRAHNDTLQEAILFNAEPEARIVETDTEYMTLKEAIEACNADGTQYTIEILKNISWTEEEKIIMSEGQDIRLNLNGKIINAVNKDTIENSGILEIYDGSESKESVIRSEKEFIKNTGKLTLDSVTINKIVGGTQKEYSNTIYSEGELILRNSSINLNGQYNVAIYNKGKMQIEEVNIYSEHKCLKAIINDGAKDVRINTTINLTNESSVLIENINNGEIIIEGGNYTNPQFYFSDSAILNTYGKVTIKGGEFNISNTAVENKQGYILIDGGTIIGSVTNNGITREGSIDTIEITGGTIKNSVVTNSKDGTIKISNNANIVSNSSKCVDNRGNGKIEITGGNINVSYSSASIYDRDVKVCGVYNSSTIESSIVITGGNIRAESQYQAAYGVYSETAIKINIGEKEGNVKLEEPNIYGTTFGVYSNLGGINFYDGTITGNTAIGYLVFDKEENYDVKISINENGDEVATLENMNDRMEAIIVETGVEYKTLKEAIEACGEEARTIKLLKHIYTTTVEEILMPISETQNVVIDLNGYYIRDAYDTVIQNYGETEIIDSSAERNSYIRNNKNCINNIGKLILDITEIHAQNGGTPELYNNVIYSEGEIIIRGAKLDLSKSYTVAVYNKGKMKIDSLNSSSEVNLVKGIVNDGAKSVEVNTDINFTYYNGWTEKYYCIENVNDGELTITGGNYCAKNHRAIVNTQGKIVIKDGIFKGGEGSINNIKGKIQIIGGNITTDYGNNLKSAVINDGSEETDIIHISGGILNEASIINNNNGTIKISDNAKIIANGFYSYNCKIHNKNNGKIEITGGIINISHDREAEIYAIYNESKNENAITVTGGIIEVNCINGTAYGIYNKDSGGITVGTDDDDVKIDTPKIKGTYSGVYNIGGTFRFYDGVIIGKENESIKSETEIILPRDYRIITELENDMEKSMLGLEPTEEVVAEVNGVTYKTLAAAIRSCESNVETKITILKPIVIENTITIGLNQNIILDLSGINITAAIEGNMIDNAGILRIIDTYGGAIIQNTVGGEIGGTGTLILGDESGNYVPNIVN